MAYTTTNLIDSIQLNSFIPVGQVTFTQKNILTLADEATKTSIVPAIMTIKEDYYVYSYDIPLLSGIARYNIPYRSVGLALRQVSIFNGSNYLYTVPKVELERIRYLGQGVARFFYIENNTIVLYPVPQSTTQLALRVFYFLSPGQLVLTGDAAQISPDGVDFETGTITVNLVPPSWNSTETVDIIQARGGQIPIVVDATAAVTTGQVQVDPLLLAGRDIRPGDWVSIAGTTPLPTMPPDYFPALALATAYKLLVSQNIPGADAIASQRDQALAALTQIHTPRVQSAPKTIVCNRWVP